MAQWLKKKKKKKPACQCRRCRFDPRVRKTPWRKKWQLTPVFLLRKSHEQRGLAGYRPCGCKRVRRNLAIKQQQNVNCNVNLISIQHRATITMA